MAYNLRTNTQIDNSHIHFSIDLIDVRCSRNTPARHQLSFHQMLSFDKARVLSVIGTCWAFATTRLGNVFALNANWMPEGVRFCIIYCTLMPFTGTQG